MKRLILTMVVLVLLLAMVTGIGVASAVSGPQTWQLDSETTTPGYQMERTGGLGDDDQTGSVLIAKSGESGNSLFWISDEAAGADVTFSSGAWKIELATESDWGTDGDKCVVSFGEWDGANYSAFATFELVSVSWSDSGNEYIFKLEKQSGSKTIYENKYLAVQITNNDSKGHTIYTAEGDKASCVTSPQTDPGYPLPEIAAGILLGGGLIGLGSYVVIRRKRTGATV
jgi:hypothetical protein